MIILEEEEYTVYIDGLRVTPESITSDGMWMGEDGMQCDIREMKFNVPEGIKGGPYSPQSVMAILPIKEAYQVCPECKSNVSDDGILLMMEVFHVYPASCCDRMVWLRNGGSQNWAQELS